MAPRSSKPRLGRGISALIGDPVKIQSEDPNKIQTTSSPESSPHRDDADPTDRVLHLPLGSIVPGKHQPRSPIDESSLADLAASIKSAGVMQPLIARKIDARSGGGDAGGKYELIAGERRWRAARLAGLETVPVIIRDIDDLTAAQWAIIENVQREDLNPIDRGMAFRNLAETFGLTQTQIAEAVAMDRSSVANLIRLTDLEPEIREWISSGALGAGHGKALLSAPSGAARLSLGKQAIEHGWTVRELERRASSLQAAARTPTKQQPQSTPKAVELTSIEKQLGEHLGTKVMISSNAKRSRGKVTINFYGIDHFEGLLARMGVRLDS